MKFIQKYLIIIAGLLSVSGCAGTIDNMMESFDNSTASVYENKKIDVYLNSFSDHRQGVDTILPTGEKIIYAYEPDELTNGELLSVLGFDLYKTLGSKKSYVMNSISVDVSIKDVDTTIQYGVLSRMGFYYSKIRARIIIKDANTKETLNVLPIVVTSSKARTSTSGRQPTAEQDRRSMIKILAKTSTLLRDEILKKAAPTIENYLASKEEIEEIINEQINEKIITVPEVSEDSLKIPADVAKQLEFEEQKLLDRKEQQQKLYEEKLLNQSL